MGVLVTRTLKSRRERLLASFTGGSHTVLRPAGTDHSPAGRRAYLPAVLGFGGCSCFPGRYVAIACCREAERPTLWNCRHQTARLYALLKRLLPGCTGT